MIEWKKPRDFPGDAWDELMEKCGGLGPLAGGTRPYRAELKHWKQEHPQVELKRDFPSANLLLIVALDGWETKYEQRDHKWHPTRGRQVRMSSNAAMGFTLDEFQELVPVVAEAHRFLQELKNFKETP